MVLSATWPTGNVLEADWGDFGTLPGDYQSDKVANGADFLAWQRRLNTVAPPLTGADGDGNGMVNGGDLAVWSNSYGHATGSPWVQLTWDAVDGATSYTVMRATSSGGAYTTISSGITSTSFHDTGLAEGVDYYYAVTSVGPWGESSVSNEATPPPIFQAEGATLSGVNVASSEAGYVGTGYAQFAAATGAYIEWTVSASQAGDHELAFRYALGGTSSRPLKLTVNGVVVDSSVNFASTGGWSTWEELAVTLPLVAGSNTVRLTSIGSSGGYFDQLTVKPVTAVTGTLRRPISPEQPMWLVHIDTWNYADPQKIIDLIPEDIRPFVVMNISLSISHNVDTSQFQVAEYGYEIAKSWLRVCAENRMWAIVQCSSGGYSQFSDFDLSVYEEFYREFPNLIGFSYAEQFWGYDSATDPLSAKWTDRITHFANLLELSHQYGGYLVVSWCGNQWSPSINPIAMLKRNPAFAAASQLYTENYILEEKYTQQSYQSDMESLALGAYLSGYSGQYGIRYDDTGWTDAAGNHENFTLVTGAAPQLEHAMLTGQTVVDGPELIWTQDFHELSPAATDNGYTQRVWDTYTQFDNVSIDLFRKVLDGTVRIPTREEVIDRTKVVVINDVNSGSADDIYSSPETLFEGLYRMEGDGNYELNMSFFKATGRYPTVPTAYRLDDAQAQSFAVQVDRSDYNTLWPTIADKVDDFNSLFPQEYTGDLYAGRLDNAWVTYNPFKTGQSASASIPFQYNTSDRMELTYSQYTTGVIKEYTDSVTFYLNNYDNVLNTGLKTDTIKIYGSTQMPTWSYEERGEHQASVITSDWTGGVFTLTVQHNGAVDITVQCAGTATGRLSSYAPATITAPNLPMVYTGPLQHEAEVFDYKNISGVTTSGYSGTVRNYTGQGYLRFGTSSTAAVRDTFTVLDSGTYQLQTRYAVTGANITTVDLYVNGVKVADPIFTQTATLSDWAINVQNITLNAGTNTFELRAAGTGANNLYLDNMVVVPTTYGDGLVIQEDQSGFAGVDGTIDANYAGYTGTGFANTADAAGAGINWVLNFDSSLPKSFTFRYSSTVSQKADLIANGVTVASDIQFASTGSYSNWGYVTVYATVPAGYAALRLQATSATGLPNIDSLEVFGADPWSASTVPFTPVGLAATPLSISQIELDWWLAPGADSYNVLRASATGGPYTTIATGVTGTSFIDSGLSELATYYYVVSAVNTTGESANSAVVSTTTLTDNPPAAPTDLNAIAAAYNQVNLSWTASPGADSYIVKRSITNGGPYITVGINVTGTSFADSGLFGATSFYYVVSAVNELGEGVNSTQASATTLSTAILEPVEDTFVRDGSYVDSNFGSDTTLVVKNDGGAGFTRNTFLKFNVSGLTDAQSVQLKLTPYQIDANDAMSVELVTIDSWSESLMTWNNQPAGSGTVIASVTGFVVGQPKLTTVTSAVTGQAAGDGLLSLKLSKPAVGNNYVGFHSSETADTSLRPVLVAMLSHIAYPAPATPTGLTATAISASQIDLSWSASSGATRYNVRRASVSGGPYTLIAAGVQGTAFSDIHVTEGQTYYYVVSATNGTGESGNSSQAGATAANPDLRYQESGGILSVEAEHGTVGSRWLIGSDAGASGGAFIEPVYNYTGFSPEGTTPEYLATYEFTISTSGNYGFWFRTYSNSFDDDSLFWRIDSGSWTMENGRSGIGSWFSTDNTQVDSLSLGDHVLEVSYRENGTRLDKFVIQLDSLTAPTGAGPAESNLAAVLAQLSPMAFADSDVLIALPAATRATVIESATFETESVLEAAPVDDDARFYTEGIQLESIWATGDVFSPGEEQVENLVDWIDELASDLAIVWG